MLKKIKNHSKEIQDKVWERILEQKFPGKKMEDLFIQEIVYYEGKDINNSFQWDETPEGHSFWHEVHYNDEDHFYTLYPKEADLKKMEEELFSFFKS